MENEEIWVYKDENFDAGVSGGATVAVFRKLEEAIAAYPPVSHRFMSDLIPQEFPSRWHNPHDDEYYIEVIDITDPWDENLPQGFIDENPVGSVQAVSKFSYSSVRSITKTTWGAEV